MNLTSIVSFRYREIAIEIYNILSEHYGTKLTREIQQRIFKGIDDAVAIGDRLFDAELPDNDDNKPRGIELVKLMASADESIKIKLLDVFPDDMKTEPALVQTKQKIDGAFYVGDLRLEEDLPKLLGTPEAREIIMHFNRVRVQPT